MEISIFGINYEVREVGQEFENGALHLGEIDYKDCVIKINKNMSARKKEATLVHEVLHGLLVEIGREDLSEDETLVTTLGNAIYQSFVLKGEREWS